ncbi:MAG: hypothetical protein Q7U28_04250 [Aquabacterium sp.]|nr:hypothetical protein [Aquabacterium sp.]
MTFSVSWVLCAVAAVMAALAVWDTAKAGRITPAAKTRLLIALIFVSVVIWNAVHLPAHDFR